MKIDLWRLDKKERKDIQLNLTHLNIHYNQSKKYKHIVEKLESEIGNGYRKEIWCFITNVARAIKYRAKGISTPRDFLPYKENKQSISHKRMIALFDFLESNGYIESFIGGVVDWHSMETVGSCGLFTSKTYNLFEGVDVSDEIDVCSPVQIKDRETKEILSNSGRRGVGPIKKYMDAYNEILFKTEISKDETLLSVQQYKRCFSDNLTQGGRHYNMCGGVQVMNQQERSKLKINGESVTELDFKAMHPSLLYEQEYELDPDGVQAWIDSEWDGDYNPYGANLPFLNVDWNAVENFKQRNGLKSYDPIRNLVKHTLMICMNGDSYKSAYTQVTGEVRKDQQKQGTEDEAQCRFYGIVIDKKFPGHTVVQAVAAHNKPIAHYFFTDQGVKLQYLDSEIVADVLNRLLMEDEVLLPEHDSVIVRRSIKEKVKVYMEEAYTELMGNNKFCCIEEK